MRKLLALVCAVVAIMLLNIGCTNTGVDLPRLEDEEIMRLRAQYPMIPTDPPLAAMGSYAPAAFENIIDAFSHVAIIEVVSREEDVIVDMAAPGNIFEDEKKKQESLGYEMAPGAYDRIYAHYKIRVEKVLWENRQVGEPDEDGGFWITIDKPEAPIEDDKEYVVRETWNDEYKEEVLKPGRKLVVALLWGRDETLLEGYLYFSWG